MKLEFEYFVPQQEINSLIKESISWKQMIRKSIPPHISDDEKIWLLYDYLARQVHYGNMNNVYGHTILGPLSQNNHTSVCEGIAKAFKFLCDECQIPCIIVYGTLQQENHAWNIVTTSKGLRHIDVTNEIYHAHLKGIAKRTHFCFQDHQMNNYQWNNLQIPKCI